MNNYSNDIYKFTNTTVATDSPPTYLPTSAMCYNGKWIEEEIDGYLTLSVAGREMIGTEITTNQLVYGNYINGQRVQNRELTITYKLEDADPRELQIKFRRLMHMLNTMRDVPIKFNDDLEFMYVGRYHSAESIAGDSNTIISSFTIYCGSPYKYTAEFASDGVIYATSTPVNKLSRIEVDVEKRGYLRVTNGRESISITGEKLNARDKVIFNVQAGKVFVNGIDRTNILDLTSDFRNFTINNGDEIVSDNGELMVYFRGVSL